jgi:RHS repeat-associated protein
MTSYAYNALNQLVSLTDENGTRVFSYDANGNCVNDGKRLYEWDVQNRLVRVIVPNEGEVRFRYRVDGMRVEKQVVGGLTTKYIYDGQTVIGEIRSDGTKRWYVMGAMGYVCRIDEGANGEILARDYFVYDGLGSCSALVSSNGIVVAKYDYDVYGSVRDQEGQRANSFKYVAQIGHVTDEETGLIYMRARYYDPEIGRFVSEDPGQYGVNWFIYANNAPIQYFDMTGREPNNLIQTLWGQFLFLFGMILIFTAISIPTPQAAYWEMLVTYNALKSIYEAFRFTLRTLFSVNLNIFDIPLVYTALKAILQAAAESGILAALVPGGVRLALIVIGYTMITWGLLLINDG